MSDEAPRPKQSRTTAIVVLLGAGVAAVLVASISLPSSGTDGRASTVARRVAHAEAPAPSRPASSVPNASASAANLAQPVVPSRVKGASPFDEAMTDSAVRACVASATAAGAVGDVASETDAFADVDPTKGRPDSLIVEGTLPGRVWHCASTRRYDGGVANRTLVVEQVWDGAPPEFPAVHAVTVAAEESCLRAANKLFREFVFRGVRHEQRGEVLYVTGDAFPINNEDLVGDFSCNATVRGGRIVDATASNHR